MDLNSVLFPVVCEGEPEVANGTTDWDSNEVWPEGSHVQGTCNDGLYLYPSLDTQQRITCTYDGWKDETPCEQGAKEANPC